MSHLQFLDELVKEYLCFRGFTGTLKALDNDLKVDKDKGFRVDKILDHILQSIYNYDLNSLRDTWNHLECKIFSKLEQHFTPSIHKLENAVYKLYLVNASVNNKQEKIIDFFSKMTPELIVHSEWKDWFVLPYIKNPEENPTFALYFTKQWQDTFLVSLHNLLAAVYQSLQLPTLANFEEDAGKMSNLQKENEILRKGIASLKLDDKEQSDPGYELDTVMDDFYNITQEIKTNENQSKMLRTIMRTVGAMPASPKQTQTTMSNEESKRTNAGSRKVTTHVQTKRSLSTDSRISVNKSRERDLSLDTSTRRSFVKDLEQRKSVKQSEEKLLFLSQEEYNDHAYCVTDIKFNTRGNYVASCDVHGFVKVWSVSPSTTTISSYSNTNTVLCVEWLPHAERCVTFGDIDSNIKFFNYKQNKITNVINSESCRLLYDTRIEQIVFNQSDSTILVIASGKLLQFDTKLKKFEKSLITSGPARCCCISNNNQLLVACEDNSVELTDVNKNVVIRKFSMPSVVSHLKFLPNDCSSFYALTDNMQLIHRSTSSTSKDSVIELNLLNSSNGQSRDGSSRMFTIDNSGFYLLTVGFNSGVVYKVCDDEVTSSLELKGHKCPVTCLDWSFANQCATCVTASTDGNIKLSTLLIESN